MKPKIGFFTVVFVWFVLEHPTSIAATAANAHNFLNLITIPSFSDLIL
jgi:hypothetical protein